MSESDSIDSSTVRTVQESESFCPLSSLPLRHVYPAIHVTGAGPMRADLLQTLFEEELAAAAAVRAFSFLFSKHLSISYCLLLLLLTLSVGIQAFICAAAADHRGLCGSPE